MATVGQVETLMHAHTQKPTQTIPTTKQNLKNKDFHRRTEISFLKSPVQDTFERERQELEALTRIKLVLKFHPVNRNDQIRVNESHVWFVTSTPY